MTKRILKLSALGLLTLLSLPLAIPALAQDNGTPPEGFGGGPGQPPPDGFGGGPGQPPPDGFGGGPGQPPPDGFGGGNGQQPGGFGGGALPKDGGPGMAGAADAAARPQWLSGTVSAVDTAAGTITLTTTRGTSRTVKVAADTQVTALQTAAIADLKIGDSVSVRGVPTGITASQITDGQPPAGLPGAGGPRPGPMSASAVAATPANPPAGAGNGPAQSAFAMAGGTIKALPTKTDPHLALTMGPDTVLYLKMTADATVNRYVSMSLSEVKTGDRIMASVRTESDGSLTATAVGLNLPGFDPNGRGAGPGSGTGPTADAAPGGAAPLPPAAFAAQ